MRKDIKVRFAESKEFHLISLKPELLKDILIINEEVFATIDETRIAMTREDYNKLFENEE